MVFGSTSMTKGYLLKVVLICCRAKAAPLKAKVEYTWYFFAIRLDLVNKHGQDRRGGLAAAMIAHFITPASI